MVATLRERMGSVWTLSWSEHGLTDGVGLDVNMIGTWILRERMGSLWMLSWLGHGF